METIIKVIGVIIGATIAIPFIVGIIGTFAYMIHFLIKNGWKEFEHTFIPN